MCTQFGPTWTPLGPSFGHNGPQWEPNFWTHCTKLGLNARPIVDCFGLGSNYLLRIASDEIVFEGVGDEVGRLD